MKFKACVAMAIVSAVLVCGWVWFLVFEAPCDRSGVGPDLRRSGSRDPGVGVSLSNARAEGVDPVSDRVSVSSEFVQQLGRGNTSIAFRPYLSAATPCSVEFVAKGAERIIIAKLADCGPGKLVISWDPSQSLDYVLYLSAVGFVQRAVVLRSLAPGSFRDLGVIALDAKRRMVVHLHSGIDLAGTKATLSPVSGGGSWLEAEISGQVATFEGVTLGSWKFGIAGLSCGIRPDVVEVKGDDTEIHVAVALSSARAKVSGRVSLESGVGLGGVTVRCGAANKVVTTDANGLFEFDAWSSERVAIVVFDKESRIQEVSVGPFEPERWMAERIEVRAKATYSMEIVDGHCVREVMVVPLDRGVLDRPIVVAPQPTDGMRYVFHGLQDGRNIVLCTFGEPYYEYGAPRVVDAGGSGGLRLESHCRSRASLRCLVRNEAGGIIPGAVINTVAWVDLGGVGRGSNKAESIEGLQALRQSSWCIMERHVADEVGTAVFNVPVPVSDAWGVLVSSPGYCDSLCTAVEWSPAQSGLACSVTLKRP